MSRLQRYRLVEDVPRTGLARLIDTVRSFWIGPVSTGTPDFERLFSAPPSRSGIHVSEHTALTYSAFWACVNAISTDLASLPLIHYKRLSGGGKERYLDSKLYRLLHDEPNPEMTSITMRQTLTAHALSWGNGYAEIERDQAMRPLCLWPLTPGRVVPYRDTSGTIVYLVRRADGAEDTVPAADMLHIPGLGFDGVLGYSVVTMARESIGLGLAAERFGSAMYGNGLTFGGVISYPGPRPVELSEKNYRESLEAKHQGVDRAHKLLALYNGAKYERNGLQPNDAQFLETRLHQVEEMCRWFRMPPHKIQHLLRATNNNIEQQGIEYYTDTLRPWTVRWEQEINRKLIFPAERRIQFVEHMIEGVLRGDLKSRYDAYAVGRQWGWLSADDVREKENQNPLPNGTGKIYLVPLNMTPADRITELIDAQIAAKKRPPPPRGGGGPNAGDPNAIQTKTLEVVEAIRAALIETQQRAEAHLTRAALAEADALRWKDSGEAFRAEAETERAAAAAATRDADALKALLLEATQRADQEQRARELAEADATRARAKHAKATAHITTAQAAAAEAERKRQVSEGNLDQALVQAALAEARAATLAQELSETSVRAGTAAGQRDAALAAAATHDAALAEADAALIAARATLAERDTALRDAEARIAALDGWRSPADFETQAAEVTRLEMELDARQREQTTALLAVRTAEQRVGDVERQATEAEAALEAEKTTASMRMTAVIGAHRGLIADAMGRMIRRETEKARRAQATPEKLRHWIETFYPAHEDICRAALLPAIRAHLAWQQSGDDPAVVTQTYVQQHIAESIRQLRLVLDSDPEDVPMTLETTLRHWELERADALADVILREAIDHVRA